MIRAGGHPTRGFTLVELLVVITIMLALGAIMIPSMRTGLEGRRMREAARNVNVYLGTARNRAIETGRPAGVIFQRDPNLRQASVTMQQAEVPPPYAGDWENSRIVSVQAGPGVVLVSFPAIPGITPGGETPFGDPSNPAVPVLVRLGDLVQLNYQGPTWTITGIQPGPQPGTWLLACFSMQTSRLPVCPIVGTPPQPLPMPFQFFLQPMATSTPSVTLPTQMAIDLLDSGTDSQRFFVNPIAPDASPVIVMFSPNGALDAFYLWGLRYPGQEPVFLLIGRRDRVTLDLAPMYTPPAEDGRFNLADTNNLWVTVFPQTGLVTTAPMASSPGGTLAEARRLAREGQRMGGQ